MKPNEESITVVVPCYNVENYLARCLDSLVRQTYQNLEVIMVEDCSTDNTKKIVREYEKTYSNFHAIYNKKNGGLGNARNVGIAATKTRYICFLDSDDWLPDNFASEMHAALVKGKADLSICDVVLCYDDSDNDQRIVSYIGKPDKHGLINTPLAATSSAKLFKTELFDGIRYPVGIVNEDIPVTLAMLSKSKVVYTDKTHFSYYQRPGSIQNGKITSKRLDVFTALELLKQNAGGQIDQKLWLAIVWHQVLAVYLYVLPRADSIKERQILIEGFYDRAKTAGIRFNKANPGFRQFLKNNRIDRVYGNKAVEYFNTEQHFKSSVLMGAYQFVQNNIHTIRQIIRMARLAKLAVLHPIQFAKKLYHRLKRQASPKYVINTKVTLDDVLASAKKQSRIKDSSAVSAIIPNYNYERYLLQRVYSILYQTQKVGEIIILDDNSKDNSVELAKKIQAAIGELVPVRLINNTENHGTFSQWEKGFREAKYEYIWIAEADDYCASSFLENALAPLVKHEPVVISYVNTGYVNAEGLLMGDVKNDIDYQGKGHWDESYINSGLDEANQYSYINNTIANVSSVVFRKKPGINYAKLFNGARKFRQAGDWVFYVEYMMYGDVAYTDKVLNYYRIHGNNVSSTTKAQDHISEILRIQKQFTKKLGLTKRQQANMQKRIKFLKKAWNV